MKEELLDRFRKPSSMRWVPLSALKATEHLSCIDGRHDDCIIAAPGGDMGELVLLLSAVEHVRGAILTDTEIYEAVDHVLRWHLRFYMHTDEESLTNLANALNADPSFDNDFDLQKVTTFVLQCPPSAQNAMLIQLTNPDHIGCGFIKLMLQDPQGYRVRKGLVVDAVRSYYRLKWSGSTAPLLEVLPGEHQEQAVISIKVQGDDQAHNTFVPSICNCEDGPSQIFVNHQSARNYLLGERLRLMADHAIVDPSIDEEAVLAHAEALGQHQMATVVAALAPHLPIYELEFCDQTSQPIVRTIKS